MLCLSLASSSSSVVPHSSEMGKEEERPGLFCSPQKSTAVGSYLLLAICVQDPIKLPTEKVTESQLSQCSSR